MVIIIKSDFQEKNVPNTAMAKIFTSKKLTYDLKDLPNVFCRLHNFEQLPFDSVIEVEYVIDTDTDRVYKPP